MDYAHLPQEITELKQWVVVSNKSKLPLQVTGKVASSSNPETWCDFETAKKALDGCKYNYIGFVFNNNGIVGIDIDAGFDGDLFLSGLSIDIMRACGSYTEKSRSGRGVHIFVKGELPFKGRNNRAGVEIYQTGRYFIMTGEKLIYDTIKENQPAIDYIISEYFSDCAKEGNNDKLPRIYSPVFKTPANGKIQLKPTYPPIPDGARNISLTSLAGQLHNCGYSKKEIYQELLLVNNTACKPPLPLIELESITNSVSRYKRK